MTKRLLELKVKVIHLIRKLSKDIKNKCAASLAEKIKNNNDPIGKINSSLSNPFIGMFIVWNALLKINEQRHPAYDVIIAEKKGIIDEEICYLIDLKSALSTPGLITKAEISRYTVFFANNKKALHNEQDYRKMLISLIIKNLPSSKMFDALSVAGVLDKITSYETLKILRKAALEGSLENFTTIQHEYQHTFPPVGKVKCLYWEARLKKNSDIDYKYIEKAFLALDKSVVEEYRKYLLPLVNSIEEEKNYLDYSLDDNKLNAVKEMILSAVSEKQKFSFVRLNDGEGYGFSKRLPCDFDMDRQEYHWWGEILDPTLRSELQERFKESLHEHDLVAIPSIFRLIDELRVIRDVSIYNNALVSRLFIAWHGYLELYNGNANITEGQINLDIFDEEYINRVSSLASQVVFVSGVSRDYLKKVFGNIDNALYIELPTHRLLKTERFSNSNFDRSLPHVYERYLKEIKELAAPGTVFFISGGFIGKIFSAEISKKGGIALDVGQALINIVASHIDA